MLRTLRHLPPALLIAILGIAPAISSPARARDAEWSRLVVSPRVSAGETVMIELPEAPGDVEEMEILLSLDDGRTYPYRVTADRQEEARRVPWEVPNVQAPEARLRLRYRVGGRETDGVASAPFVIVPDPHRAPERRLAREEEDAEDADREATGGGELRSDSGDSLHGAAEDVPADPPAPTLLVTRTDSRRGPAVGHDPVLPNPRTSSHTPKGFRPLRI